MSFFGGKWLTGLLTRYISPDEQSRDSNSNSETSIETQECPTGSDDSDNSEASASDTHYSSSSRNHSPIKSASSAICTSSNILQSCSGVDVTHSRENTEDSKECYTPASNKNHSSSTDAIWKISRSMASDQEKSYFEALNPSASSSNIERSSPVSTTSKTAYSNPISSMNLGNKNLTTTGSKRVGAKDCSSERSSTTDSDPDNPWTKVIYSKKSRFRITSLKNSGTKALNLESSRTTVADSEKSSFKVTDSKICYVETPCLEISKSLNSMSLELVSSNNQTSIDSTTENSETNVTNTESSPTIVINTESSKLTVTSPKNYSVMNTTREISNTRDSMEFLPISSNKQAIEDENKKNSSNYVTNTENSKIVTSPNSSTAKDSSQDNYNSIAFSTESFDSTDSRMENSWITVSYSKNRTKITSQKNSSLKGQSQRSPNNADYCKKNPAAVSYSKESKPKLNSPKNSSTTVLNLRGSTNPKNSRNTITNKPRSDAECTQNIRRSGPFLKNKPRICKMKQNSSTSKTENMAHSSTKVGVLDESRNLGGNLNCPGRQVEISVPLRAPGKARYSEVVRNSLSNAQSTNKVLDDTQMKTLTPSGVIEMSSVTFGIAKNNEIEAVAKDCVPNPPTIIINPPYSSRLLGNNSSKSFAEDMANTSISTGNENFPTTSVDSLLGSSFQSMTSPDPLPASSAGVKNSEISTSPEDETWQNLITVKNLWGNLTPIAFARSDSDADTRCSSAKKRISPIGDERAQRSQTRDKSNQLSEQSRSNDWKSEAERSEENLGFSSLPSLNFSFFSHPSPEKWLADSDSANSTIVQNLSDSLEANTSCEVNVSSSSNPRDFLIESRHESSSPMEQLKETELLDNFNERKDGINILSQQPSTSERHYLNNKYSSHLTKEGTPESLEERVTSSQIFEETNENYSQECKSITSDVKSLCINISDKTNPNDGHPHTEGQQSTNEDLQVRHTAENIQGRDSTYEDSQGRNCAYEDRQNQHSADNIQGTDSSYEDSEGQNCAYEERQIQHSADEDSRGLEREQGGSRDQVSGHEGSQDQVSGHEGSQDQVSAYGGAQAQGSPHGVSQDESTINASSQIYEHDNAQNSIWSVLQGPHCLYPVIPGPICMYSDSAGPHTVYVNSPCSNYPYPIQPNTNFVYGNNAHPGLSSENYVSLSSEGSYLTPVNTCPPSVSQIINNESVTTQCTFQHPTITNYSDFESQVTTGTQSDNAVLNQSLPYIIVNRPLISPSMVSTSSQENLPVLEHNFQPTVVINETNNGASVQHIPNPVIQGDQPILKQSDSTQFPYEQHVCSIQLYRQPPDSFTDRHPLEPNQSSFGQSPDPSQSAYGQPLGRNQLPCGPPSVHNQYPYSQPLEQSQSICMPTTIQSPYRQSFGPTGPPHGQTPNQSLFLHGHLPDQNQTFYGQSADLMQPLYVQNPPLLQHSTDPTISPYGQPTGQKPHPSIQTLVPIQSPIVQVPEQNQQPSRQTLVPIPSHFVQAPEQKLHPSRQMLVQTRSSFAQSREQQHQQHSRQTPVPTQSSFVESFERYQQPSRQTPVPTRSPFAQSLEQQQHQQHSRQTPVPTRSPFAQSLGQQHQQHSRQAPVPTRSPFAQSLEQQQHQQHSRQAPVPTRSPFEQSREQYQQHSRHISVPNRPPSRQSHLRNQSFNGQRLEPNQSSDEQPRDPTSPPSGLTWAGWTRQPSRRWSHRQPLPKWSSSS